LLHEDGDMERIRVNRKRGGIAFAVFEGTKRFWGDEGKIQLS